MSHNLTGAAVLFDLDGTLIDTAGDLAAAVNHALASEGLAPLALDDVRRFIGNGARAMLRDSFGACGRSFTEKEMDRHFEIFLDHYLAHIADLSRPFPGAVEAIAALRAAGAKTAICTNKREAASRLLIEALGISDLFDAVVGSDTAGAQKPDPAPVRLCMELTGARRAVFVGDSDTDIKAASAAGLSCLVATFGYGPRALGAEAFAHFDAYRALPGIVAAALERC